MLYEEFKVGDLITWNPEYKAVEYATANETKQHYKMFGPDAVFEVLKVRKIHLGDSEYSLNCPYGKKQRLSTIKLPNGNIYHCNWMPERFRPSGPIDITKLPVRVLSRMIRDAKI